MAEILGKDMVFEILGTKYGIADAVEQLLWVSTALSISTDTSKVSLKYAELEHDLLRATETPKTHIKTSHKPYHVGTAHIVVAYKTKPLDHNLKHNEGQCWYQLFQHCTIVDGYPIPSRPAQQPGLEISLDMMAMLACADRVTPFGNDLIIKGFSTLLYATGYRDQCMIWHLIYNDNDRRISFSDKHIPPRSHDSALSPKLQDIFTMRHIVGWAGIIQSNAGKITPRRN